MLRGTAGFPSLLPPGFRFRGFSPTSRHSQFYPIGIRSRSTQQRIVDIFYTHRLFSRRPRVSSHPGEPISDGEQPAQNRS